MLRKTANVDVDVHIDAFAYKIIAINIFYYNDKEQVYNNIYFKRL